MKWPAWYSRFARNPRVQRTIMVLLGIMIVWGAIEKIFGLGFWSRFTK